MTLTKDEGEKAIKFLNLEEKEAVEEVDKLFKQELKTLLLQCHDFFQKFTDLKWCFMNSSIPIPEWARKFLKAKERTLGGEQAYNFLCKQCGVNELYGIIYDKEEKK